MAFNDRKFFFVVELSIPKILKEENLKAVDFVRKALIGNHQLLKEVLRFINLGLSKPDLKTLLLNLS